MRNETLSKETLFTVLASESDRGCVLVALDFLSERLRELLTAFFAKSSPIHDDDINHFFRGPTAQLSSVAARTNLAYALGLIESDIWKVINQIRELRNIFGHSYDRASLPSLGALSIIETFTHFNGAREDAVLGAGWTIANHQVESVKNIEPEKQAVIVATMIVYIEIQEIKRSIDPEVV